MSNAKRPSETMDSDLQRCIRDALSPEAVAMAASFLLGARCDDEEVDLEVRSCFVAYYAE